MKTFEEYTRRRLASAGDRDDYTKRLTLNALGLAGEAGEFVDMIKKHLFHGKELDKQAALKELGDVLWYLMYAADTLGSSLEEVACMNDEKLAKRYPAGFSHEASQARVDLHQEIFDGTGTSEDPYVVKGADGQEARFVPAQQRPALEND